MTGVSGVRDMDDAGAGLPETRVGFGFDVHAFAENRPCVIGGVTIPHDRGLLGHSDADVLTHAIADALLGAAALGDIGQHFPDTDEAFRGVSSLLLLEQVVHLLHERRYRIVNIDATVVAQRLRLSPYIAEMKKTLSIPLALPDSHISIKATTSEGLGFTGREEGVSAYAVTLIQSVL